MDPDQNTPSIEPQTTAPAPQSAAPVITPEIQAIIDARAAEAAQKANDSAWKAARVKYEKGSEPPKAQQPAPPPSSQPSTGLTEEHVAKLMARESDFVRAATEARLNAAQEGILRSLLSVEKPENVREWAAERAKAFGSAPAPAGIPSQQIASPQQPQTPPNGRPVSNGGAPAAPTGPDMTDEPWKLTDEQVASLIREKGHVGAGQELLKRFKRALPAGKRVSLR